MWRSGADSVLLFGSEEVTAQSEWNEDCRRESMLNLINTKSLYLDFKTVVLKVNHKERKRRLGFDLLG